MVVCCFQADDDISLVFVTRKFDPVGLAIPGGYVNVGESVEDAALRELEEETGLQLTHPLHDVEQIHVFSRPNRDHRRAGAAVFVTGMSVMECDVVSSNHYVGFLVQTDIVHVSNLLIFILSINRGQFMLQEQRRNFKC